MATVTTNPVGNTFKVSSDSTILSAAMEAGVNLPYGCGNEFCGACKTKLLSGDISYADDFNPEVLTDDDKVQDMILCYQAHCKTDVTLEVDEITMAGNIKPE